MRLRLELELFLWVTAAALLAPVLFRGGTNDASLEFDVAAVAGTDTIPPVIVSDISSQAQFFDTARGIDQIGRASRPIFYVPVSFAPTQPVSIDSGPRVLPILKGIISSGSEWQAIFYLPADPGVYILASVGDDVAGIAITGVSAMFVAGLDMDGVTHTFELRGAGESAE